MGKVYVWHIVSSIHFSQTTVTPNKKEYTEEERSTSVWGQCIHIAAVKYRMPNNKTKTNTKTKTKTTPKTNTKTEIKSKG